MVEKHCLTYQFIKYIPLNFSPQSILSAFRNLDLALQMFHKPNTSGKQEKAHKIVNFNNVSQPFSPYVQVQVQVLKDLYITTQWLNFPCISFYVFFFLICFYIIFKSCTDVENCGSFKSFGCYIYIYMISMCPLTLSSSNPFFFFLVEELFLAMNVYQNMHLYFEKISIYNIRS